MPSQRRHVMQALDNYETVHGAPGQYTLYLYLYNVHLDIKCSPVSLGVILLRRWVRKPRRLETTRCGELGPLPMEKLRNFENRAADSAPLPAALLLDSLDATFAPWSLRISPRYICVYIREQFLMLYKRAPHTLEPFFTPNTLTLYPFTALNTAAIYSPFRQRIRGYGYVLGVFRWCSQQSNKTSFPSSQIPDPADAAAACVLSSGQEQR